MWSQKGREDITNQSVVREKLLDFFNETNMTKYKFAKCSGLSTSTIYDIVQKEDYDVRESNIMKICKGMDVTPFELFQTDKKVLVINDPKEINVILVDQIINNWLHFTKRILMKFYQAYTSNDRLTDQHLLHQNIYKFCPQVPALC